LQTETVNSSRTQRPFTIVEDEIDELGLNSGEQKSYRKMKRLIRMCGGRCDWPRRRIMDYLGIGLTTYKNHIRKLVAAGLLVVTYRRVPGCRLSDTNVYALPKGEGSKIRPQVRTEKNLKTTTPAREKPRAVVIQPVTPALPSPTTRQQWEARHAQDREDHHHMRQRYESVGRAIVEERQQRMAAREENRRYWRDGDRHRWDGGRQNRLERAEQRTRMASQARQGMYTGEKTEEMSKAVEQEIRSRIAANERKTMLEREELMGQKARLKGARRAQRERMDMEWALLPDEAKRNFITVMNELVELTPELSNEERNALIGMMVTEGPIVEGNEEFSFAPEIEELRPRLKEFLGVIKQKRHSGIMEA